MEKENKQDILNRLYIENNLTSEDVFSHQHYKIITRSGVLKILNNHNIQIEYDVIVSKENFASVKARAKMGNKEIETFGSALKGKSYTDGNTNSWYVLEMAQKRSMSRGILELVGFTALGHYAEDESETFKRNNN
tara:strand:+ start:26 stop:430 length:405 start_codon:yes stop_codon:yes gene_type:complete